MSSIYAGSRYFESVAKRVGLPIDQFNFVFGQFLALFLAILFGRFLYKTSVSATVRHIVCLITGLILASFCFGYHLGFLVADALICYIILRFAPARYSHYLVMVSTLLCLSFQHIYRLVYDYGGNTLGISAPMMVLTQKLTDFAFCFHDGQLLKNKKEIKDKDHEKNAIRELPSLLEYWSYVLYFQCILVGPLCFYKDFSEYMQGKYLIEREKQKNNMPDPTIEIVKKFIGAIIAGLVMLFVTPNLGFLYNITDEIAQKSILYRLFYLYVSAFVLKVKYYFAWMLADAINNASRLGFNGYDEHGKAKWDLVTNIYFWKVESATSFKAFLDNWNIQSAVWLRRVCYSRVPSGSRTMLTYALSAFWHGFYPSYYFTAITAALFTMAGRGIRRKIRPFFLESPTLKFFYDIITWIAWQLSLSYLLIPFFLLSITNCMGFYTMFYWCPHICAVLLCTLLPVSSSVGNKLPPKQPTEPSN